MCARVVGPLGTPLSGEHMLGLLGPRHTDGCVCVLGLRGPSHSTQRAVNICRVRVRVTVGYRPDKPQCVGVSEYQKTPCARGIGL